MTNAFNQRQPTLHSKKERQTVFLAAIVLACLGSIQSNPARSFGVPNASPGRADEMHESRVIWPGGIVHYNYHRSASNKLKKVVKKVMAQISREAPGIRFIEIAPKHQGDVLNFFEIRKKANNLRACGEIDLALDTVNIRCIQPEIVKHQLMHIVGVLPIPRFSEDCTHPAHSNAKIATKKNRHLETVEIEALNKIYPFSQPYLSNSHLPIERGQTETVSLYTLPKQTPSLSTENSALSAKLQLIYTGQYAKEYRLTLKRSATDPFASTDQKLKVFIANGNESDRNYSTLMLTVPVSDPAFFVSSLQKRMAWIKSTPFIFWSTNRHNQSFWLMTEGQCLEAEGSHRPRPVRGHSQEIRMPTRLAKCDSTRFAQRWFYAKDGRIANRLNGRCLRPGHTALDAPELDECFLDDAFLEKRDDPKLMPLSGRYRNKKWKSLILAGRKVAQKAATPKLFAMDTNGNMYTQSKLPLTEEERATYDIWNHLRWKDRLWEVSSEKGFHNLEGVPLWGNKRWVWYYFPPEIHESDTQSTSEAVNAAAYKTS